MEGFIRQGSSTNQTVSSVIGSNYNLTKTGTNTLIITTNNTYSGITIINEGTIEIKNSCGKYGLSNQTFGSNLEALTNLTFTGIWRTDDVFVIRQYFSIDATVYPNGVSLTELGLITKANTLVTQTWVALYKADGTVLSSVSIPSIPAVNITTSGYVYYPVDIPITLYPGQQYSIVAKVSGSVTPFNDINEFSGTVTPGVIFQGGTWLLGTYDSLDTFPNQTANFNVGNAQGLAWSGGMFKFNPVAKTIIANNNSTLDLLDVSAKNTEYYIERTKLNNTSKIIRKFLPSDLPQVKSWTDFTEDGTFYKSNQLSSGNETVRIVRDKAKKVPGASFYNNGTQLQNMIFRNGRLESDGVLHANGGRLTHLLSLGASWGFFYVAQRLTGGSQGRIFAANTLNGLFGFQNSGDYGAYWDNNPNMYQILAKDTTVRVSSTYRESDNSFTHHTNDASHQFYNNSSSVTSSLNINWEIFGTPDPTTSFAINETIITDGDLTTLEKEALEGYLAHKHGETSKLPSWHTFKSVAPTVIQTSSSTTIQQLQKHGLANVPASDRLASSNFAGYSVSDSILGKTAGNTCWGSAVANTSQWFRFDLLTPKNIAGVVTQPRNDLADQGISTYTLETSNDAITWTQQGGVYTAHTLIGSQRRSLMVYNLFPSPVVARYVRIKPLTWVNFISLRGDVILRLN